MAAGALVTLSFAWTALPRGGAATGGLELFNAAGIMTLVLIWAFVPLMTSDCLSREKREGTLGLLFLTPLTAVGIILGKSLVHALRATSLLIAAIPALSISLLFGGVSGTAIVLMVLHQGGALCLSLAAGMLASAWSRDWLRSTIGAVCLTFLFGTFYYRGMAWVASLNSLKSATILFLMAVALLASVATLAAIRIRLSWQEGPPSKWALWWWRTFCSPLFWKDFLRRASRLTLERNPIGWLHERTATARVSKWIWCLGAILANCALLSSSSRTTSFFGFEIGLALAMAFAGASSFRRERQIGMMELLLVAPLEFGQILDSRLCAIRKQFAPALALLIAPLFVLLISVGEMGSGVLSHCLLVLTSWAILPALGMYFSFQTPRFITAWLLTALVGLLTPFFLARLLSSPSEQSFALAALIQVAVGSFAIKVLRDGLTRHDLSAQLS